MKKLLPGIILLVVAAGYIYFTTQSQETSTVVATDNDRVKGNTNASVTIIEYIDFQCPACRQMDENWNVIWRVIKSDVKFIVRHFPLSGHPHAMTAATYVEAAHFQGKFWEMHDIVLLKQSEWSRLGIVQVKEKYLSYAQEIGLDMDQYKSDLTEKIDVINDKIANDKKSGDEAGLQGTPSIFINGTYINNPSNPKDLLATVKQFLL